MRQYDRRVAEVRVTEFGDGPRLVLVHGSVANGAATWSSQRSLTAEFRLAILDRPGFPPNPPVDRVDFDEHASLVADILRPGDHLVGHSYGGVIALLSATRRANLVRSLTVIEPPCFAVAAGDPTVDAFVAELRSYRTAGPREPEAFLRGFARLVMGGEDVLPRALPPALEQGARTLMVERGPWEAVVPLRELRSAPFPKLVVSGAHHVAVDAVCDVLERELDADRAVLPGAAHAAQRAPGFNERLREFVRRAS